MAGNFIAMVYAVLKDKNVDTSKMTTEQAIEKYNELTGKSGRYNVETGEKEKAANSSWILPKKEYAELCSAIRTKYANNIPHNGGILYSESYYRYNYNKRKEQIMCTLKIKIEGNESKIALLEQRYGKTE